MTTEEKTFSKTDRTTNGLRETLFQELDSLRNGKVAPCRARAAASLSREIISSARIEIEVKRLQLENDLDSPADAKPVLDLV